MFVMPSWAIALALFGLGVFLYGLNIRSRWQLRHIPGPRPSWLFGNLRLAKPGIHVALPRLADTYGAVYKFFFGRIAIVVISDPDLVKEVCVSKFMQFHDRQYNLVNIGGSDPEANCTMLHGMLSARGKYWAGLRASCERVFHSGQLASYAPLMNDAAEKLAGRLAKAAVNPGLAAGRPTQQGAERPTAVAAGAGVDAGAEQGAADPPPADTSSADPASVNISAALGTMTLEVIGTSAFGVAFDTDKEDSRIVQEAKFVMDPPKKPNNINRLGSIVAPHLGRLWFLLASWTGSDTIRGSFKARGFLLGTSQVLLRNARRQLGSETNSGDADADGTATAGGNGQPAAAEAAQQGRRGRRDPDLQFYDQAKEDARREYGHSVPRDSSLLHHLLRARNKETGQPFTEHQIMAQGNTFLLAGYETTSTALAFAVAALARHPAAEARLLAEVDALPWADGAGVPFEQIGRLPYARAVVDEAMRYWPPVTPLVGLQREAAVDTSIGGFRLPAGSKIWVNVQSIHHDARFWPEPEVFRPERFLEGSKEAAGRHPYAYLPFGVGPRKCIGYRFALEEAVITLAQLYRRFTFKLDPARHPEGKDLELGSGITLHIKDGCWVVPMPRG